MNMTQTTKAPSFQKQGFFGSVVEPSTGSKFMSRKDNHKSSHSALKMQAIQEESTLQNKSHLKKPLHTVKQTSSKIPSATKPA